MQGEYGTVNERPHNIPASSQFYDTPIKNRLHKNIHILPTMSTHILNVNQMRIQSITRSKLMLEKLYEQTIIYIVLKLS